MNVKFLGNFEARRKELQQDTQVQVETIIYSIRDIVNSIGELQPTYLAVIAGLHRGQSLVTVVMDNALHIYLTSVDEELESEKSHSA